METVNPVYVQWTAEIWGRITPFRQPGLPYVKEARKGFFVDVVFAKRWKITKKDI